MGVIMHNNILYGGGSSIEPNPQESATDQLETLGIDGDVYEVTDANAIHTSDVGVANGIAELDANGFVPSSQLPSYVDDVLEYASRSAFPATGETGKIYVALDTNLTYRWGGSDYVEISPSLALGETSSTAYRGDRGKIAYDHSQSDHSGIKPAFTEASTRANIASGESFATLLGKIKKWFSDLKDLAFIGKDGASSTKYLRGDGTWQNFPTITTVNDGTLTIQKNGTQVATFSANQSGNATANITVPEVGETDTTDTTPYLYRASQNSGDRCYLRQLVGASFGVNQLIKNISSDDWGVYSTSDSGITFNNGVATITLKNTLSSHFYTAGIKTNTDTISVIASHKYFVSYDIKPTFTAKFGSEIFENYLNPNYVYECSANQWTHIEFERTAPNNRTSSALFYFANPSGGSVASGNNYQIKNYMCINLTQMLGTTIADYIYSLGSANGIAWLKSQGHLTEDYYEYNTGSLQSVNTSGKVCGGKNTLNVNGTDTSNGYINGVYLTNTNSTSSGFDGFVSEYVYIFEDKDKLTLNGLSGVNPSICFYDKNKTFISGVKYSSTFPKTVDIPSDAVYYRASVPNSDKNTAIIEYGSSPSPYEPYTTHTTNISPIDLRGVPKLVDNSIVYDGDVRDESGVITRNYGIVDLGTQTFSGAGVTSVFYCSLSGRKTGACKMIISNNYSYSNPYTFGNDKCYIENDDAGSTQIYFKDSAYTSYTDFKTAMSGVYLVYELATPTTEQATPIQNPEIYNQFGWEQFIDDRNYPIPVGHNSEYVNLPDWLEDGYYKDFRQRVDETLPNAINALSNTAVKVIAKNGEYDASVLGLNDMPNCSLSLDKGTYLIMAWCYFTVYNIDTNKEYGCAICDSSNTILSYDGHKNRTESAEGSYGATSSTFILETITADATVRKLRGYMCKSVTGKPIKGGIVAFKIA